LRPEQEALLDPNRRFADHLRQRHFAYELHIKPGGHDWREWNSQIPGCFERLLRQWQFPDTSNSS